MAAVLAVGEVNQDLAIPWPFREGLLIVIEIDPNDLSQFFYSGEKRGVVSFLFLLIFFFFIRNCLRFLTGDKMFSLD